MTQSTPGREVLNIKRFVGMPKRITKLVEDESDRGAILILAAYLEEILGLIVSGACVSQEEGDKILEFRGPAGGFDLKIQLCKALALIHPVEVQGLDAVRKIRNCAAHFDSKRGFDVLFDSQSTIDNVANLAKSQNLQLTSREPAYVREVFIVCVRLLATKLYFRFANVQRPQPLPTVKETANEYRERMKGTERGTAIAKMEAEIMAGNFEIAADYFQNMVESLSDHIGTDHSDSQGDGPTTK
jgi:hypothetical protein